MQFKIVVLADVPAALDLVKEEVAKADHSIREKGADAIRVKQDDIAKGVLDIAARLADFVGKINTLGSLWKDIEKNIELLTPEAREIIRSVGWTRNVPDPIAPKTNFKVQFPDGTLIAESKANATLAKTIEKIGPEKVSRLHAPACLRPNGEPLVTNDQRALKKYPDAVLKISGGWFVNTHSSTKVKADAVREISRKLHLNLKVMEDKPIRAKPLNFPPVPIRKPKTTSFPYAVGKVVQAVFPTLQNDSRMTVKNVSMLAAKSSSKRFKTGGNPVLKPRMGKPNETMDAHGHQRYYQGLPLKFFGKDYWLTSQFNPQGIIPVLAWLKQLGFSQDELIAICEKCWGQGDKAQTEFPL